MLDKKEAETPIICYKKTTGLQFLKACDINIIFFNYNYNYNFSWKYFQLQLQLHLFAKKFSITITITIISFNYNYNYIGSDSSLAGGCKQISQNTVCRGYTKQILENWSKLFWNFILPLELSTLVFLMTNIL